VQAFGHKGGVKWCASEVIVENGLLKLGQIHIVIFGQNWSDQPNRNETYSLST
jgi:hypothetical protein